jgi:hypothetical protein
LAYESRPTPTVFGAHNTVDSRLVWLPHDEARPRLSKLSRDENAVLKLAAVDELLRRERFSRLGLPPRLGRASTAIMGSIVGALSAVETLEFLFSCGAFTFSLAGKSIRIAKSSVAGG